MKRRDLFTAAALAGLLAKGGRSEKDTMERALDLGVLMEGVVSDFERRVEEAKRDVPVSERPAPCPHTSGRYIEFTTGFRVERCAACKAVTDEDA